jgi:DNA-binding phage protein
MKSYEMERLRECVSDRSGWRQRTMYWARQALQRKETKVAIAAEMGISRLTLDDWLKTTPDPDGQTILLIFTEEEYRRLDRAAIYAGESVREFAYQAIVRRTRDLLRIAQDDEEGQ